VSPLHGCVNDIDAIQRVLVERLGVPPANVRRLAAPRLDDAPRPTDVPTLAPTRDNVLAALRALGSEAVTQGDRVFVYYSGHGAQLQVNGARGGSFVREALLPTDHRIAGDAGSAFKRQYLFDWELNALFRGVAARTSAVSVVLDCCCSAGATRDLATRRTRERYADITEPVTVADAPEGTPGVAWNVAGGMDDCLVVAACLDNERARESDPDEGRAHGELTRALLDEFAALEDGALDDLRWDAIWRSVIDRVARANPAQHPWLSGSARRRVFGGAPEGGDAGFSVTHAGDGYRLGAGSLSGVTAGALIAVYAPEPARFAPIGSPEDVGARLGVVRVAHAERASAVAVAVSSGDLTVLPRGARARTIEAGEAARLVVGMAPYDASLASRLATSSLVTVAPSGERGDVTLVRRTDGAWALTDDVYGTGEGADVPSLPAFVRGDLANARSLVEHYHRHTAPLRLARACVELPRCLRVTLLDCAGFTAAMPEAQAQDPDLPEVTRREGSAYVLHAQTDAARGELFCVRVENTSTQSLHVTLLLCADSGTVSVLAGRVNVRGGGRATFWHPQGMGFPFQAGLARGRRAGVDRFVAVGTTDRDATLDHLEVAATYDEAEREDALPRAVPADLWTATVAVVRVV
jgi:hypothetical protein